MYKSHTTKLFCLWWWMGGWVGGGGGKLNLFKSSICQKVYPKRGS